jgi:hypothetical protein
MREAKCRNRQLRISQRRVRAWRSRQLLTLHSHRNTHTFLRCISFDGTTPLFSVSSSLNRRVQPSLSAQHLLKTVIHSRLTNKQMLRLRWRKISANRRFRCRVPQNGSDKLKKTRSVSAEHQKPSLWTQQRDRVAAA